MSEARQLLPTSAIYPSSLRRIFGELAPPRLHYLGNLDLLERPSIGFCGSRRASTFGLDVAEDFASQLAKHGVVAVSGYAKGVDTLAHRGALRSGGATIVVLPEGIEQFRVKTDLRDDWDWDRVLVLSQFEPNAIWRADRAMERNRLIVSLSRATIVIEAGETGGTLDAGMTALRYGFPLFVVHYLDSRDTNVGNRILLENGGHPIGKNRATGRANVEPLLILAKGSRSDPNS